MKNERRGNLYLLTGLVIGIAIGLLYGWVISPVQYIDTEPTSLAAQYKDQYRRMVALAYQANGNLDRARSRLALLDAENPVTVLAAQAQRMVGENQSSEEARALALLAADLGKSDGTPEVATQAIEGTATQPPGATPTEETPALAAIQSPTVEPSPTINPTPQVTQTARPTLTPRPSATPQPTLSSPFVLDQREEICDGSVRPGLLQVQVLDANDVPVSGVRISISWQDGEDFFYTGLAPEINPGYADFVMQPGVIYQLKVAEIGEPLNKLQLPGCNGGIKLIFKSRS